jgi:DNA-binding SARP family transcriptional activator
MIEGRQDEDGLLTLGLLGGLELSGAGEAPVAELLVQPKRLALLIYLAVALPRGFRRRDELVALFWPESDTSHARNSLRQSIHVLRRHLPAGVLVSRGDEEVGLRRSQLSIDAEVFEDLLNHGQEEEALPYYRGELLPGFHLSDCPDFELWLDTERERLCRRAVRAALVLARRSELDDEPARAAEWARYAEQRAPYDEGVLREVLELLVDLGDRAGAARLYAASAQRFRKELDVGLSAQTEEMGRTLAGAGSGHEVVDMPRPQRMNTTARLPLSRTRNVAPIRLRPITVEARQLYLRARDASGQRSPATIMKAIELFEQALRLSPDYAEAHAGLTFALTQALVYIDYAPTDALPRVRSHALRAIRLDPSLGEAHAMLGQTMLWYDYDWRGAEELFLRALDVDSISDVTRCGYALYFLTSLGRFDEALELLERTRDSLPSHLGISTFCGMVCIYARQYERARQEADAVIERQSDFAQAHWVRGMALEGLGKYDAAIATFDVAVSLTGGRSLMLSQLGRAHARAGNQVRAEEILSELDRRRETSGPAAYYATEILAALGRIEEAIDRLYAAYRERIPFVLFAGVRDALDPLRGERRFRELLMRIGLHVHERASRIGRSRVLPIDEHRALPSEYVG